MADELEHGWAFALAAIVDDAGEQVVWRPAVRPEEHTLRLMATLGVRVEVAPVSGVSVQDVTGTRDCAKPMCVDEAMPGSEFCRRHESITELRARLERDRQVDALEAMDNGLPQNGALAEPDQGRGESRSEATPVTASESSGSASAPASIEEGIMADVDHQALTRRSSMNPWTREEIIAAIQRWAEDHGGQPPVAGEWVKSVAGYPTQSSVIKHFGKWTLAIAAAGFTPRSRGGQKQPASGRAATTPPATVEPTSSVPDAPAPPGLLVGTDEPGSRPESTEPTRNEIAHIPHPESPPDPPPSWTLALTGDFTGQAQRVRHEAALLRRQAAALDVIASGIDQLAEPQA